MGRELLIGAHMSIAGGIHNAFDRGKLAGCRTIQVFLKNSTQWKWKKLIEEDRLMFCAAQKRTGIGPVVAHSSYLINLATPERALRRRNVVLNQMLRDGHLDQLEVIVELSQTRGDDVGPARRQTMAGQLQHNIKSYVGISARVTLTKPGILSRSAGRAMRVVDKRSRPIGELPLTAV